MVEIVAPVVERFVVNCLRLLIVIFAFIGMSREGATQAVDLQIPNLPQQTDVWCWVAVAEQIIRWRNVFTQPVPFSLLMGHWQAAIVVN